jgi:hypothetical protein
VNKYLYVLFVFFLVLLCDCKRNQSPVAPITDKSAIIAGIIKEANADSILCHVRVISGEVGSTSDGQKDTIYNRDNRASNGHVLALNYITKKLLGYGLSVQLQNFLNADRDSLNTNILAYQIGSKFPERKYIICAHYDAFYKWNTNTNHYPAADDNASGVAAVMEAARIISRHKSDYTILYAIWDLEELSNVGETGSLLFARLAFEGKDTILGVINMDMIGWDANNDYAVDIHSSDTANSIQLANAMVAVNQSYSVGLNPVIHDFTQASDHRSFWYYGYGAISLSEAYLEGDMNPHYDEASDSMKYFNNDYYLKCSRLSIATLAYILDLR